jgi:hypothetical protein
LGYRSHDEFNNEQIDSLKIPQAAIGLSFSSDMTSVHYLDIIYYAVKRSPPFTFTNHSITINSTCKHLNNHVAQPIASHPSHKAKDQSRGKTKAKILISANNNDVTITDATSIPPTIANENDFVHTK